MTQTPEHDRSGGETAFRWRALLRVGAWLLAAAVIAVAVLVVDELASSGSSRSDPGKLRMTFAILTGIPMACAAASFFEFVCGVPFAGLEARWRAYRHRRLATWLVMALAVTAPVLVGFLLLSYWFG